MRRRQRPGAALTSFVSAALITPAPTGAVDEASEPRRRRAVVALTLAVGATLLGFSLHAAPGSAYFYPLTTAVAATWVLGGLLSGPLHLGHIRLLGTSRRPILTGFVIGLAAVGAFLLGALVVREIGPLRDLVESVLAHARKGSLALVVPVTVANGIAEEVFFRGALFTAIGRGRAVPVSTVVYLLVTLATGNLMLTFAAASLGIVFALERRASGGILSAAITHVTWSLAMLFALPHLFP
ncbi:MAG: type II CAAX endopeptidase family protein [Jatrophihabitantaceae bacterium]